MNSIEEQIQLAVSGDKHALENVVLSAQQTIYKLAIRFLWHPQDAEDATQEILIKVITGLNTFRGDSHFTTWVYRIASNTLLSLKKKRMEQQMSFDEFADDLSHGLADSPPEAGDTLADKRLVEEVKIGCTLAMLMCLDRKHRLAYILGEILELNHAEAATVLAITPAGYRKQLSRARLRIASFMAENCGLSESSNACRCDKRVNTAVALKRVDPNHLLFASSSSTPTDLSSIIEKVRLLETTQRSAAIYQSYDSPAPSPRFITWLQEVLNNRVESDQHKKSV